MKRLKINGRNIKLFIGGCLLFFGVALSSKYFIENGSKEQDMTPEEALENAFRLNPALQDVVAFYRHDPLKQRAARYLISNLAYHTGVDSADMRGVYTAYGLFATGRYDYQQALDSAIRCYGTAVARNVKMKNDVYIDPGYLVNNIEWAFKAWREQPWGKHVPFEQFCEYVLPYRVRDEKLEPWRERIYYDFMPAIERHRGDPRIEDPLFAAQVVLDSLFKSPYRFTGQLHPTVSLGPRIMEFKVGSCTDLCDLAVYIFRALGIPCATDEMPLRGDNNVPHFWNAVVDTTGQTWYFSLFYWKQRLSKAEGYGDVYGKVLRHRFSLNRQLFDLLHKEGNGSLHPRFRQPLFEDVTHAYAGDRNFTITLPDSSLIRPVEEDEPLYLCMSARMEWRPVACAIYNGNSASFPDCHGGTVYCLATYDAEKEEMQTVSHPFSMDLETGALDMYIPSRERQDVALLSKFGMIGEFYIGRMVGGVFEGSNSPTFEHPDTLAIIHDAPTRLCTTVLLPDSTQRYRYVRYFGPYKGYCNLSEVAFYAKADDREPIAGSIMGTERGSHGDHSYFQAMDGNTDTSYDHPTLFGGWVGLDMGSRRHVGKIVYSPRHRDNFVRPGDTYELMVCDSGIWKSAGRQLAESDSLLYRNIPRHALLLLRNRTRGVDERIFEYEDNRQKFW